MKKLLLTMVAASALSIGAPALAQYAGGSVQARLQQLQIRLDASVRGGAISRGEAMRLRDELRRLTWLERRLSRDGLSRGEIADLEQRMQTLRRNIRFAERYADNRYDRNADGFDDRFDRNRDGDDDRFDRDDDGDDDRFDRNDDDRDDRFDRNRDGDDDRFDRDNDGDDDRYDRDDDDRDDRFDRNDDGLDDRAAMLSVGQRAGAGLFAVPPVYRNRYRDSNSVYYRSDGRAIYGIDARTGMVVTVYPIPRD